MQRVKIYAPATIGNVGPGFDVLGMAITNLGDIVEARRKRGPGVEILKMTGYGADKLPYEAEKNTAGMAALKTLERIRTTGGVNLIIDKGVPYPCGLGSSAASAVAAAKAVNLLYGEPLSDEEVLEAATEAEAAVSGGFFADNTAAALYGGVVVTFTENGKIKATPLGTIPNTLIVVATPEIPMPTKKSRGVLPKEVPMKNFVANMAATATMVAAVGKKDPVLFGRSVDDRIVEPARKGLITGFDDVKAAAMGKKALGCSIAGAGATIFALAKRESPVCRIGEAMKQAFLKHGIESTVHICNMDKRGARLIK
jgi:homoserine kinase